MDTEELIETFEFLGDWEERYRYIIELGRKLPPMPESEHTEANKVRGCMSQVWLAYDLAGGPEPRMDLRGDSDAHIVKGLIALLFQLVSGKSPQQILDTDISGIFERLGLDSHISMNRRNGFYAMVERIQQMAKLAVANATRARSH